MSGPRRLIVNADDFGLTAGVNRAVERAHSEGVLTSTTVLVNQRAAQDALAVSRRRPDLAFGVHVNLTLGSPTSDAAKVRSLVNVDGRFHPLQELLRRLVRGQVDRSQVRVEVESQITQLRTFGVAPTHWDSHQAAAFWPGLIGPAAAAAEAAGITAARSPRIWVVGRRSGSQSDRVRWTLRSPKRLVTQPSRLLARHTLKRFRLPDWRLSPNLVDGGDYQTRWARAFATVPPGTSEIVSHPAEVDDELRKVTPGLVDDRAADLSVLISPSIRACLAESRIRLITFRDL